MSIYTDIKIFGGTQTPTEKSNFEMTVWHIPGGYDYVNAYVIVAYFEDIESVQYFVNKYRNIPEMAEFHPFVPSPENIRKVLEREAQAH